MLCFKFRFKIAISKFVILFVKKDSLLFYLNSLIDFLIMFFLLYSQFPQSRQVMSRDTAQILQLFELHGLS